VTRRKRWVMLALLLVPAALVVATVSVMRHGAHRSAARAPHLVIPNGMSTGKGNATLLASALPALIAPADMNDTRKFNRATQTEENEHKQNSNELPTATATLADNYTAPPYAFDSYVAQENATDRTQDAGWSDDHHYRGSFDLGLMGSLGGGSSTGVKGDTTQNTANNEHGSQSNTSGSSSSSSSSAGSGASTQYNSNGSSSSTSSEYNGGSGPVIVDTDQSKPEVSVPEPATWSLFGLALLGVMLSRRQRA